MNTNTRNIKHLIVGKVTKKSGDKTVNVNYSYSFKHKKYKKIITFTKKYLVHDEKNECQIGDVIQFYYARPLASKKSHNFYKKIVK